MLTAQMKRAIAEYIMQGDTKPLIEDLDEVGPAYLRQEITLEELDEFLDGLRTLVLEAVPAPNPGQMTDAAKKHHIETAGQDCCPYCTADANEKVEWEDYSPVESGDIQQIAECMVCGRRWQDVFRLIDVNELCSQPKKEDPT